MYYTSTRGKARILSFTEVANSGLASDGGLYVPEYIPLFSLNEIKSWKGISYQELAYNVMQPFIGGEIPENDLKEVIAKSYTKFKHKDPAPIHELNDNKYILELFHGPTLAFKDFALQFLGNLLEYILERDNKNIVIIGATSGDTGSAAIEGFRNSKKVKLFMLHPYGRISDVQRRQMTTVISDNIFNLAVETDFDGCQEMVKEMFRDQAFVGGRKLVAVNSINWARIMAQIVYYFYAALKLGGPEKKIIFSVPTGNFGDIYAGYMAYKMGLPVSKLLVATNKNDILHRFFSNNDYSRNNVVPTLAPSMDIQISSNFERLLFDFHDKNGEKISELMDKFKNTGRLSVDNKIIEKARIIFASHTTNDSKIKEIIAYVHRKYNYIIDPHTATAVDAADSFSDEENNPVVILSTAHPAKFMDAIYNTISVKPALPGFMLDLMKKQEKYEILRDDINLVKNYISEQLNTIT